MIPLGPQENGYGKMLHSETKDPRVQILVHVMVTMAKRGLLKKLEEMQCVCKCYIKDDAY